MQKQRIIFRADGDFVAGYGHVIRALSLVHILKKQYTCIFIIRQPDLFLKEQIGKVCNDIIEIPSSPSYSAEATQLTKTKITANDIVVLDGYHFDKDYQTTIKKACFKVICIDDIYDRHFTSDVVINHSEGIKPANYSKEFYTQLYLGTQYAILRQSFLKNTSIQVQSTFSSHNVFINMGGTDQKNYTKKALALCIGNKNIKSIDIVIGSYYSHFDELKKNITSNPQIRIRLHSNISELKIASLMKKSNIGICSASTISYEYACVGGLLFVFQTVLNQKNIYSFLIKTESAFSSATFDKKLVEYKRWSSRKKYFLNRQKYFSKDSIQNIISIFQSLEKERNVSIRKADASDVLTYFKWTNNPDVRKSSINTSVITLENHTNWFLGKLKSKTSLLFVIENNKTPIGQVRLDKSENNWEIDYSVEEKDRGKGFGKIILKNAIMECLKLHPKDTISGKVKIDNHSSNGVFEKLNFTKLKSIKIGRDTYNRYILLPQKA